MDQDKNVTESDTPVSDEDKVLDPTKELVGQVDETPPTTGETASEALVGEQGKPVGDQSKIPAAPENPMHPENDPVAQIVYKRGLRIMKISLGGESIEVLALKPEK